MTVSIKAAKKATVRRFARAVVVAALLSTPGAAQGDGGTMPDNCKQNLDLCSEKIWPRNSFSHSGSRQSVTFSDGAILTCTSNGPNKPRSCTLNEMAANRNNGGSDDGDGEQASDQDTVRRVQAQLRQLGFYNGPIDGKFDDATREALRRYQYENRLPASGKMDDLPIANIGEGLANQNNAGSDGGDGGQTGDQDSVRRVQAQLRQLGFYNGPIDGKFDDSTREALRRYQYANRLPASGKLDDLPPANLGEGLANHNNAGSDGGDGEQAGDQDTVRRVQAQLHQLGFYNGPIDGKFGDATREALRRYQYEKRLPASGKMDDLTLAKLGIAN